MRNIIRKKNKNMMEENIIIIIIIVRGNCFSPQSYLFSNNYYVP